MYILMYYSFIFIHFIGDLSKCQEVVKQSLIYFCDSNSIIFLLYHGIQTNTVYKNLFKSKSHGTNSNL